MNRRGFILIIYLAIGAVVIASVVFGINKYEDEITTNISGIFKSRDVVYNITPTTETTVETPQVSEEEKSMPSVSTEALEESTTIIEKLKKEIEALKKQPPQIVYKEIIKEVLVPTSTPSIPRPELTPLSSPTSPQQQSDITPGDSVPDLLVQSSIYYPSAPIKDDIMTFFATIKNQSEGQVNSFMVSLSIDGVVIGKASTMTLSSNKSETITWGKIWKATFGNHALEICADADFEIAESDENNNCRSYNFFVSKTMLAPDYVIDSTAIMPTSPTSGEALSFIAVIHNQGNTAGNSSSFTSLKIDINNNGDWNIAGKNAITEALDRDVDEKEHWDFIWAAISGTHKYQVCADATSLLVESNENNNCTSKIFAVP